jgi:hypothetical protein
MVTSGLYRFVRHPQYISLTIFGLGILLTWGRAITFIAFFLMMILYYYLAKTEEATCIRLFGEDYERYREKTSFIFPGDRLLRPLGAALPLGRVPAPLRVMGSLALSALLCLAMIQLISTVKGAVRTVDFLTAEIAFGNLISHDRGPAPEVKGETAGGVNFVRSGRLAVVRGPYRNAAAPGFAERLLLRLPRSKELGPFLAFLDQREGDSAFVFSLPYTMRDEPSGPGRGSEPGRRGPPADPDGPDKVRVWIMRCSISEGADLGDAFVDSSKRRIVRACQARIDLGKPGGTDIFDGELRTPGPRFPGEKVWTGLMERLADRREIEKAPAARPATVPGRHAGGTVVLVKAPILRTRLDPPFAEAILRRMTGSKSFRKRLFDSGVGGEVIALAFPRPGPNWYSEHHGNPQISLFVILARRRGTGASLQDLFDRGERDLLGAFTAEMDFGVNEEQDSIGEKATIGPRRDLEERFRFFLSGL